MDMLSHKDVMNRKHNKDSILHEGVTIYGEFYDENVTIYKKLTIFHDEK